MNKIEIDELNEMREQLATLKKQLESQEIVNDRLIKETMTRKLSSINRRAVWPSIICAIYIPLGFIFFHSMGLSLPFCCATSALFTISLIAMIVSHFRLRNSDILNGNLVATYKEVARMRKIYKNWRYWSIPMLVVWFVWFEYEAFIHIAQGDITALLIISSGGIIGGIFGGVYGIIMNKRTLREATEIMRQIEELQQMQ